MTRSLQGIAFSLAAFAATADAALVTVSDPNSFNDGWAVSITYDNAVSRGTANDRDNPLNALGKDDGKFFELGTGGSADFGFGTLFNSAAVVFEVTFGNAANFPESVDVFAGLNGVFTFVTNLSNAVASSNTGASLILPTGNFDTIRLTDTSNAPGAFDVDAVRVSPVPAPAAALLFLSAAGLAFGARKRIKSA